MLTAILTLLVVGSAPDTIRLEVGSPLVDARVYRPHRARVRIRQDSMNGPVTNEWVNELTLGDSAGRPVMRWTTTSMIGPQKGSVLRQTYDGVTLAPLGYLSEQASGARTMLRIDGRRVTGQKRTATDTTMQRVDMTVDRMGFIASASDLVPLTVGMATGSVIVAPVWGPAMATAEDRVFTVGDRVTMDVEGKAEQSWRVEERRRADGALIAIWYLTDRSPYMVAGEMFLVNGKKQYATEIALPPGSP